MRNSARALPRRTQVPSLDWMFRTHRSITVSVLDRGREVDGFRASSPWILRFALRPIYRRLEPRDQVVRFSGAEERWLPGGLLRSRDEVELPDLTAALAFLARSEGR